MIAPSAAIAFGFDRARRHEIEDLLRAYEAGLGLSLAFQDFQHEMLTLPGDYAPPDGAFAMACLAGRICGLVALRAWDRGQQIAEMKRLYVAPDARGHGLGRQLAETMLREARRLGYVRVRLDTLPSMREAQALYADLGFADIANYNGNPIAGSRFLEVALGGPA